MIMDKVSFIILDKFLSAIQVMAIGHLISYQSSTLINLNFKFIGEVLYMDFKINDEL